MQTKLHIAARPRIWDRAAVRVARRRFDRALANGASPEERPALALRARQLTRLSRRRVLARAIHELARDEGRAGYLRVAPLRGRTAAATDELSRLADALAQPAPVSARGVAQALLLLTDGTGPLYNRGSKTTVRDRAVTAEASLSL